MIDVPTGEVRALASYPTFDLNTFDEQYAKLADDDLNLPAAQPRDAGRSASRARR